MQAFSTEATRPFHSGIGMVRWNGRKRRLNRLLRNFGRTLASGLTDLRLGPLKALHDSRSLLAARVINDHRHLIQDYRCIGVLQGADDFSLNRSKPNLRNDYPMSQRLYFPLAILMAVFAFAHVIALQKLNAMQSERPAAVLDINSD